MERRSRSVSVVEELRAWTASIRVEAGPKSPLGKATGYIHRQWAGLTRFLEDPRLALTNNDVERG